MYKKAYIVVGFFGLAFALLVLAAIVLGAPQVASASPYCEPIVICSSGSCDDTGPQTYMWNMQSCGYGTYKDKAGNEDYLDLQTYTQCHLKAGGTKSNGLYFDELQVGFNYQWVVSHYTGCRDPQKITIWAQAFTLP